MSPFLHAQMRANEAFIRRAALLNQPFVLKGSYLTRQYFAQPRDRQPADLDWVAMQSVSSPDQIRAALEPWMNAVIEMELDDGVRFESFRKNSFWRMIDYAMDDDFPTVNTDLSFEIDGVTSNDISLDISFNLDLGTGPVPLLYQPAQGEAFTINHTVPLALQVAWKIHQSLVRPRFKDLFDLCHLLRHPAFDKIAAENALMAVKQECMAGQVNLQKLEDFLQGRIDKLFPHNCIEANWQVFRHNILPAQGRSGLILADDRADTITDVTRLPEDLGLFLVQFHAILQQSGLALPRPNSAMDTAAEATATRTNWLTTLHNWISRRN